MEEIVHDIESEKKLVSMLGYNLNRIHNSSRWSITDENNNQVGFIQYEKIFKKNDKKGHPATFGYHMEIDNSDINYNFTRKIENISDQIGTDTRFNYEFDIKRKNGNIDHLKISVGEYPSLTLWSKEYGFMNFKVDYDGLHLNFKSKTENFNVEETVAYQIRDRQFSNLPLEYIYRLSYSDKSIQLDYDNKKGITSRQIVGKSTPYQQDCNEIKIIETTWRDGKEKYNRENVVAGSVEEMILKHKMGIDAFNHFRFLINKILPFKQEVIFLMLEEYLNQRDELSMFIPELGVSYGQDGSYGYSAENCFFGNLNIRNIEIEDGEIVYAQEDIDHVYDINSVKERHNKKTIYDTLKKFKDEKFDVFIQVCKALNPYSLGYEMASNIIEEEMEQIQSRMNSLIHIQQQATKKLVKTLKKDDLRIERLKEIIRKDIEEDE